MTKSDIGTTSMGKNDLKASDICRIIEKCIATRVKSLRYGDLHIEFNSPQGPGEVVSGPKQEIQQDLSEVIEEVEAGPRQVDMFDEQLAEDSLHAQLLIDDPLAYEKVQMLEGLEQSRMSDETV